MEQSRYNEMLEQARTYHHKHPEVWDLFCQFTLKQIERGFKHYGAHAIFQRIRWETDKPDVNGLSEFKIANNHFPFYSRAFMKKYPEHDGFFRIRRQFSADKAARGKPEPKPSDFPYIKEPFNSDTITEFDEICMNYTLKDLEVEFQFQRELGYPETDPFPQYIMERIKNKQYK